jgi:hypothetical protein
VPSSRFYQFVPFLCPARQFLRISTSSPSHFAASLCQRKQFGAAMADEQHAITRIETRNQSLERTLVPQGWVLSLPNRMVGRLVIRERAPSGPWALGSNST